jgi:uncharacterized damage-inducible protein DinB
MSALAALLGQLCDVIALMPLHLYRAQPAPRVSGSVGAHVRHTLDHVSALLAAIEGNELDYEHRKRGTGIETDAFAALATIEQLQLRLGEVDESAVERPISFATLLDPAGPPTRVRTTLSREVAFVVQHTIHHCALIAVLLDMQGVAVPHGFGVAPVTERVRRAS